MFILSPKVQCGGHPLLQPSTLHKAALRMRGCVQRGKAGGGSCVNMLMVLNTNGCIKRRKEYVMSVHIIPFKFFSASVLTLKYDAMWFSEVVK